MATKHAAASKSSTGRAYATKSGKRSTTPPSKRWSGKVTTDSTKPAPGIFKESAKVIADNLESKQVSPKGPGQGMQMLSFYENRAGKNLTAERKHTLEHAKDLLRDKEEDSHTKSHTRKAS
jgi:tRNA(adenine34) deaminase